MMNQVSLMGRRARRLTIAAVLATSLALWRHRMIGLNQAARGQQSSK